MRNRSKILLIIICLIILTNFLSTSLIDVITTRSEIESIVYNQVASQYGKDIQVKINKDTYIITIYIHNASTWFVENPIEADGTMRTIDSSCKYINEILRRNYFKEDVLFILVDEDENAIYKSLNGECIYIR